MDEKILWGKNKRQQFFVEHGIIRVLCQSSRGGSGAGSWHVPGGSRNNTVCIIHIYMCIYIYADHTTQPKNSRAYLRLPLYTKCWVCNEQKQQHIFVIIRKWSQQQYSILIVCLGGPKCDLYMNVPHTNKTKKETRFFNIFSILFWYYYNVIHKIRSNSNGQ